MAALLDWAAGHPAAGCLVAEDADGPAGFLLWGVEEEFGDYVLPENRLVGRLSDLWVEPRARGCGLARRLVRAAEAHLAAHGIARVEVSALPANRDALAAYAALGYSPALVTLAKRTG
jgi:GNAT superfamily N-acetyltransferase